MLITKFKHRTYRLLYNEHEKFYHIDRLILDTEDEWEILFRLEDDIALSDVERKKVARIFEERFFPSGNNIAEHFDPELYITNKKLGIEADIFKNISMVGSKHSYYKVVDVHPYVQKHFIDHCSGIYPMTLESELIHFFSERNGGKLNNESYEIRELCDNILTKERGIATNLFNLKHDYFLKQEVECQLTLKYEYKTMTFPKAEDITIRELVFDAIRKGKNNVKFYEWYNGDDVLVYAHFDINRTNKIQINCYETETGNEFTYNNSTFLKIYLETAVINAIKDYYG